MNFSLLSLSIRVVLVFSFIIVFPPTNTIMANEIEHFVFGYYTFQLATTEEHGTVELLDGSTMTIDEIQANKNKLFELALREKQLQFSYWRKPLSYKVVYDVPPYFVFKLANYRSIKAEINFEEVHVDHEPSVYIIIQNDPDNQIIAIEYDQNVFANQQAVADVLHRSFRLILHEYHLVPEIVNKFDEKEFWAIIQEYQNRIQSIQFEFVKENNSRLYENLAEELSHAAKEVNSHRTILSYNAPKDGVLEKITPNNDTLNEIVRSASNGIAPIKIKIAGKTKPITTKTEVVTREIEYAIEGEFTNPDDAADFVKNIMSAL